MKCEVKGWESNGGGEGAREWGVNCEVKGWESNWD
jgi:hypothetical protein